MSTTNIYPTLLYSTKDEGQFMILVVLGQQGERIGIALDTGYVEGVTQALLSYVSSDALNTKLDSLVVPDHVTGALTLGDSVLLVTTTQPFSNAEAYIENREAAFYVPKRAVMSLMLISAITQDEYALTDACKGLIGYLLLRKKAWKLRKITYHLPRWIKESVSSTLLSVIDEKIFTLINNVGWILHPHLLKDTNTDIGNSYKIAGLEVLGSAIISSPDTCTKVSDPLYIQFVKNSLKCLANEETLNVLDKQAKVNGGGVSGGGEDYLFSLRQLSQDGKVLLNYTQGITRPLHSIEEGLQLLNYFAGFDIVNLDLSGNSYITGSCIAACFHGSVFPKVKTLNGSTFSPLYPEVVIDGKEKLSLLYPEVYTIPVLESIVFMDGDNSDTIENLDVSSVEVEYYEDLVRKDVVTYNKRGEAVGRYHLKSSASLDIVIDVKTDLELKKEALKHLEIIKHHFPDAELLQFKGKYITSGTYRDITFTRGSLLEILSSGIPMTRGWVTGNREYRDCVLSATNLWSAFHRTNYNYIPNVNSSSRGEIQSYKEELQSYYNRGYELPEILSTLKCEIIGGEDKMGESYGIYNQTTLNGLYNIFHRLGNFSVLQQLLPNLFSKIPAQPLSRKELLYPGKLGNTQLVDLIPTVADITRVLGD